MAKSKNRKGQKKKAQNWVTQTKNKNEKAKKEVWEAIQKAQQEILKEKEEAASKETSTVVEDLDIGDSGEFEIETEETKETTEETDIVDDKNLGEFEIE